jgi:hypothetical protein
MHSAKRKMQDREYYYKNRERILAQQKERRDQTGSAYIRAYRLTARGQYAIKKGRLKFHYDLTPEEWDKQWDLQGHCCAVCKCSEPPEYTQGWHTDHDHDTNKFRGIVCRRCNWLLGHAEDDPSILRAGAKYLEEQEK